MSKFPKYGGAVFTLALLLFFALIGYSNYNIATPVPAYTTTIETQIPFSTPTETPTHMPTLVPIETLTPTPAMTPSLESPCRTNTVAPKVNNSKNDTKVVIVYVTQTGKKYHKDGCSYLKSKNETTLSVAKQSGYTPCSRCKPPQ